MVPNTIFHHEEHEAHEVNWLLFFEQKVAKTAKTISHTTVRPTFVIFMFFMVTQTHSRITFHKLTLLTP